MGRLIGITLCLVIIFSSVEVRARADAAQIELLDRTGKAITSLVDGNQIQFRLDTGAAVTEQTSVRFTSPGLAESLGECVIATGNESCTTPPAPALGWYWNSDGSAQPQRTIIATSNTSVDLASLTIALTPRPVVMVHGFNSNYEAWTAYLGPQGYLAELGLQGFAVGDGQVQGVMQTGSLSQPFQRTNSMAQNAAILGEYIKNVQQATGAEQVDLLVHSMGGMISRYYIDRLMEEDHVAQLIILGTPMAGSACAILPASLGMMLPATLEIQPSYMTRVFNQQIVRRKGVPFYALAGTKLLDAVTSPCTPVPSDVVVTVDSVRAIPMPVEEAPLLHTEMTTSREVFEGFVTRRLKAAPGEFEAAPDPPPGSNAPASQQFTRVYTGHLNPGETQDVVIQIDPNVSVANFALFDTSRSIEIQVTGASGQVLALDPVQNGVIRIDDPSTMIYLGYGFRQPRPGRWIVTLQTTDSTPASGADYAIAAQFDGGALLETTQDVTVPRVGETVTILATLSADGAAIPLASVDTILHQPDGSELPLEVLVNGAQAEIKATPRTSGIYGIEVNILAETAEGNTIDRAAFLTFEAQPTSGQTLKNQALAVILFGGLILLLLLARRRRKHNSTG